ncbi:MAG: NADP-dependent malic enzyme, partial [Dictyoglomus sp.]
MDIYKESLELHRKYKGKIKIEPKVPLNNKYDLSLAYTPGVAEVSKRIFENNEEIYELTIKGNSVAVISDGSAVLGLGNIGPLGALPVMEGKALLFKKFANIDAFPICLNTQDPEKIIEITYQVSPVFGGINLEDIAAPKCFYIEKELRKILNIPVFHDDQHGT